MEYTGVGRGVLTSESANAAPADRKFFRSCIIIETESLEAARQLIENDIYYTSGVVSVLFRRMRYLDFVLIHGMTSGPRKSYRSFRS